MAPGALQSIEIIERLSAGTWGIYLITRTGEGASFLAGDHAPSYINRSIALFRNLAGIPTDQEPPGAR